MLGKRLKELREDKTQEEIAKLLGIKRARYALYEQNRTEPNIEILNKLAKLYNITVDYITGNTETTESDEINSLLETLHKRPEMKALFNLSKNATKEDIEKTIKIIEALKDK